MRPLYLALTLSLLVAALVVLPANVTQATDGSGPDSGQNPTNCTVAPTPSSGIGYYFEFANGESVCGSHPNGGDPGDPPGNSIRVDGTVAGSEIGYVDIHTSCSDTFQSNGDTFTGWSDVGGVTGPNPSDGHGWQIVSFDLTHNGNPASCSLPPSTTVPSTTVPSTTVPSTTVPSTTVPSTTVPSTTVPSTTVPSTTVPSTTVPSTTVPSTTVPSTTVPPSTDVLDLLIEKTDDIDSDLVTLTDDNVTQEFTYTLTVTNAATSTVTATDVVVNDPLPERLTGISATPSTGTCTIVDDVVNCELGSMVPGQVETIEVLVSITRLAEGEAGAASLDNVATVSTPDLETTLVNNVDNEPLNIIEVFALEETLPVTGTNSGELAGFALVLVALGGLMLLAVRKEEEIVTG